MAFRWYNFSEVDQRLAARIAVTMRCVSTLTRATREMRSMTLSL
jgi:hypothetical protein